MENNQKELNELIQNVKAIVLTNEYESALELIRRAMQDYPHCAIPHNLMGIVMEKQGEKKLAMAHYRAAYSLESIYLPARCNMERMASMNHKTTYAFDEDDCPSFQSKGNRYKLEYDEKGIGHVVRRDRS